MASPTLRELWRAAPLVCCLTAAAAAQERSITEMRLSLSECIDHALQHNAGIVQSRYAASVADVQVDQARSAFLPSVSASYGLSRQVSGPREGSYVDPATGLLVTRLGKSETSGSQSVGANLNMSLYDRGNWASLAASKHGRAAAEMDLDLGRQQVVFQVRQQYFALLQGAKLQQVQEEQMRVLEEDLRRAETLYEMRSVPVSDVLSARAGLESARATLIDRENRVEIARADLAFTMGLDAYARVVPTEQEFEVRPPPLTFEAALGRALAEHPDLQSRRYAMMQAQEELKATRYGVRHPTVSMSSGYSWRLSSSEDFGGLDDMFRKNYGLNLGLNVSLPLFNRMSTENSVKTQKLNYLRSQEAFDQAQRQVALDIKQAFLNLEQYRRSIAANQASVRAAEESFKLAQERYELRSGTFLERLQAQTTLFEARNSLVQAQYNHHIQLAQLEQAVGAPLDRAE